MTYTAKNVKELRTESGSLLKKIANELLNINDELITQVSGALASGLVNTYAFTWQNPESVEVLVERLIVDITTAGGTATAILDVGVVANATSTAADIINDLDLDATGVCDHLLVAGAGLGGVHKVDENGGTNDWITGKILTEAASALVGNYYVQYRKV